MGFTGSNCQSKYLTFHHIKRKITYFYFNLIVKNNPCISNTCQNGGTCYADNLQNTQCFCKEGFGGENCELVIEIATTTTASTITTSTATLTLTTNKGSQTFFYHIYC